MHLSLTSITKFFHGFRDVSTSPQPARKISQTRPHAITQQKWSTSIDAYSDLIKNGFMSREDCFKKAMEEKYRGYLSNSFKVLELKENEKGKEKASSSEDSSASLTTSSLDMSILVIDVYDSAYDPKLYSSAERRIIDDLGGELPPTFEPDVAFTEEKQDNSARKSLSIWNIIKRGKNDENLELVEEDFLYSDSSTESDGLTSDYEDPAWVKDSFYRGGSGTKKEQN